MYCSSLQIEQGVKDSPQENQQKGWALQDGKAKADGKVQKGRLSMAMGLLARLGETSRN
jgi:hypothetical protein